MLLPPPRTALAVEVAAVDGVGAGVVVVVAGAARDGVDGQEAAGGGVVEAGAHEGELGEGVAGVAAVGAEPAVPLLGGGGVAGKAVFGGFGVVGQQGVGRGAGGDDVSDSDVTGDRGDRGRDVSITNFTASSRNSGENVLFARANDIPLQTDRLYFGPPVRKVRGSSTLTPATEAG